jgi:diacylglycerol kinase (ATP)
MDNPDLTTVRKQHPKAHNIVASFRFALSGIARTLMTQRNMKIHVLSALFILLLGLVFPFDFTSKAIILLCIALVLFSEVLNTAMEAIVDLYTGETHRLAQIAKDAAAGGVMLLAVFSVFIFLGVLESHQEKILAVPELDAKLALIAAFIAFEAFCLFGQVASFLRVVSQGLALIILVPMAYMAREPIFGTAAFLLMALISFAPAIFKNDEEV